MYFIFYKYFKFQKVHKTPDYYYYYFLLYIINVGITPLWFIIPTYLCSTHKLFFHMRERRPHFFFFVNVMYNLEDRS